MRFKSFVSERTAPLRPAEDAYIRSILQHQARGAEEAQLPDEHMSAWRKLANDDALSRILKDPDFYFREGHIVTVGEAPEENIDVERSYTL